MLIPMVENGTPPVSSKCSSVCSTIGRGLRAGWHAFPGLVVMGARLGSTLYIVNEVTNFALKQESGEITDHWETLTAAVISGAAVTITNLVTKFIVMKQTNAPATPQAIVKAPTQCCANYCNPGLGDNSYHLGYKVLQTINLGYALYIVNNSSLSGNAYVSGKNIGANVVFGLLVWGNVRSFIKCTLPQMLSAYKNIFFKHRYSEITVCEYFDTFVCSALFGVSVFFTTPQAVSTLQKNTLSYVTDKTPSDEVVAIIAGVFAFSAFVNSCVSTFNARFRNKNTDFQELLAKVPSMQRWDIMTRASIVINDFTFATITFVSVAKLPERIHESYKDLAYHPGVLVAAGVAGLLSFRTSLALDLGSYGYTLEQMSARNTKQTANHGSIQASSPPSIVLSSKRNGLFYHNLRDVVIHKPRLLTVDSTEEPSEQSDEDTYELSLEQQNESDETSEFEFHYLR